MKFIIGLGNPGSEYKTTKHNVGFNVVLGIAKDNDIDIKDERYGSLIGRGTVNGVDTTLILPQTFMNLSGKAVEEIFRDEIKDLDRMLVICDDINLELGKIRMRKKGSSGGQKGLGSIINVLGKDAFARLRIGIATDVVKGDITHYVLTPFKRKQSRNVTHALKLAKDAATCWLEHGTDEAMTKFNKKKAGTS